MKTLAAQLHAALKAKDWSIPHLLELSGLEMDRTSLLRKLSGQQKLSTQEAETLARTLECTLVWMPEDLA